MLMFTIEGSSCNNNRRLTFFVYEKTREKTKHLWGCVWPPPIAPKPRTDTRFIANAPLFFRRWKCKISHSSCDGQLSFWHWNIQVDPSLLLLRKCSTSSTLPWQKRQVTDSLISCSLLPTAITWPWSFCHVSVFSLSRSAIGSSTVIYDRIGLP